MHKIRIVTALLVCTVSHAAHSQESAELKDSKPKTSKSPTDTAKKEIKPSSPKTDKPNDLGEEVKLFDGKTLKNWRIVDKYDFDQHGKTEVRKGSIHLEKGSPATGISTKIDIPKTNYEFSFSARRVDGSDFFCGLTFPIKKEFCTLILGGWGGQIVGLSNIDSFNAAENNTTQVFNFKNGQWYKIRLRVTDEFIRIWLDGEQIIEVEANHHKFSIYWEQEPVRPLGLVTWYTHGELKDLKLHKLKKKSGKDAKAGKAKASDTSSAPKPATK